MTFGMGAGAAPSSSDHGTPTGAGVPASPGRSRRARRLSIPRLAALAAGLIGAVVVAVLAVAPSASQVQAQSPLLGLPAPDIRGPTLSGSGFELAGLRGHFVVLDFFASWCPACVTEQPELERFAAHQGARPGGHRLVGVIFSDSQPAVRSFLGPGVSLYPVLDDPGGATALAYGVRQPPEKYIIDPAGTVAAKILGPTTEAGLDTMIAQIARQEGR